MTQDQPSRLTPLMQQYWEIKSQLQDEILLFRMGDFFEIFHSDAELAAPIIGAALTQRNKKAADSAKMCGVPYHSISGPIAKLLAAGHKVAICDQIEDPATAKGIVKRAVTRILTPGMVYDPDTLDQLSAHYLASYDSLNLAFVDVSTGEAFYFEITDERDREDLLNLLQPVEVVLTPRQIEQRQKLKKSISAKLSADLSEVKSALERLTRYITQPVTQLNDQPETQVLPVFTLRKRQNLLTFSSSTLKHLEILEDFRGQKHSGLFQSINRTQTSSGARLLKSWLLAPLTDLQEITARQEQIALWLKPSVELKKFRQQLVSIGDLERRLGKISSPTFNARDLVVLAKSLEAGSILSEIHPSRPSLTSLLPCLRWANTVIDTFSDDLPLTVKEGGLIKKGKYPELDELISLTQDTQNLLLELENREKEATGIATLKVRYNNVFGFYIELTKTHAHKAPAHYRRKQTLTNAERFTTDELSLLEEKVLSARTRRDQLEFELYNRFKIQAVELSPEILQLSREWTKWDVLSSLAWLSLEKRYTRPKFTLSGPIDIELSRHPVIEFNQKDGFVANDIYLDPGHALLLTGPNMAGKSTLMRQVALICWLAQIGSYVPAQRATLPVLEKIFTRIGANDALNEGLSTFMVEMSETAEILAKVTKNSLVIMDEIGRGTSTYDGMSLAQAILEHLMSEKCPYLFFATHYHELTRLESIFPQLVNAHMSVSERSGQIRFLYTLQKGAANRSYGIHVGQLAGLPKVVTERAQKLLRALENSRGTGESTSEYDQLELRVIHEPQQPQIFEPTLKVQTWVEHLKNLDLAQITPLEALNKLYEWQKEVSS